LAVVHAALVCSSRTRQAAAMSLAGRSARRRNGREDRRHHNAQCMRDKRTGGGQPVNTAGGKTPHGGKQPTGKPHPPTLSLLSPLESIPAIRALASLGHYKRICFSFCVFGDWDLGLCTASQYYVLGIHHLLYCNPPTRCISQSKYCAIYGPPPLDQLTPISKPAGPADFLPARRNRRSEPTPLFIAVVSPCRYEPLRAGR